MPLKAKVICSRGNTIKAWSAIAILFVGLNTMTFFTVTYESDFAAYKSCFHRNDVALWFNRTDSVLESYLPCSIILTGNVLILVKVQLAQLQRAKPSSNSAGQQPKADQSDRMTAVTTAFVLLTSPYYVWVNGWDWWNPNSPDIEVVAISYTFFAIAYHLLEMSFAINFILYCVFGERFRAALKEMMGLDKKARPLQLVNIAVIPDRVPR